MATALPTPALASRIVQEALGRRPVTVTRFTTGLRHFVYEARFDSRDAVVVRLSRVEDRAACKGAVTLSRRLRPMGVPLPKLLADGSEAPVPFVVLERLAGCDLGEVASGLEPSRLEEIARRVAAAQAIVATLPDAGRYGYAVAAEAAPFACWSDLLSHQLARIRGGIAAGGLFDPALADLCAALLDRLRRRLDGFPATAFFHDTTTKNVIVTPAGEFSGIVDVDDLCWGDPRLAPSLTLASFLAGSAKGGPVHYVETWMTRAGWEDDAIFRFYVAMHIAAFIAEQGRELNGNVRGAGRAGRMELREAFQKAVARAQGSP